MEKLLHGPPTDVDSNTDLDAVSCGGSAACIWGVDVTSGPGLVHEIPCKDCRLLHHDEWLQ